MILLFIAIAWGVLSWKKPRTAILWFPVFLPFYVLRTSLGPLPTTLLELSFWTMALGVTVATGWRVWTDGFGQAKAWHFPVLSWIIATLVAVVVAPNHLAALGLWRAYVLEPILLAVLLAATLKQDEDRATLLRSLVVSLGFVTAYAVIQFATGQFIPHPWDTDILTRRATGPFPFPNALSLFAAPLAALFFGLAIQQATSNIRHSRLIAWLGFAMGTLVTILAKSVGGSLGIAAAVLAMLVWNKKTRMKTLWAVACVAFAIIAIPQIRTPVVDTLTFQGWSGKVRLIIWNETENMLKDRPFFGAGLGAYPDAIKPYHKATFIEIFQYPHNILLNLWSETGLLGILAFGWICVTWIRQSQVSGVFILPLLAILVHGLVDVPYFKNDLAMLFWILAALAISVRHVQDHPTTSADSR